ncbi:aminotransferase class III-fold pyridoxal phosphate-dependent enzyme [Actinomadura madurae]|uniref:aminotransferase class III-fold pyridoxal phosphate-dependent enzyme n=1 Tax=Actinomadura madurae TaxID=1993 RepID=UPI00399C34D1
MNAQTQLAADEPDERYERITAGAPEMSHDLARAVLREHFGLRADSLRTLPGETDRNLHVVDDSGEQYVLKLTRSTEKRALEFQTALLRHIARRDPDLSVPRVVTGPGEDALVSLPDDLVGRVLTWVPGTPLADMAARSAELLADVGTVAGRLAAVTAAFTDPAPPAPHYWEFGHVATVLEHALPSVADSALHRAITRLRDADLEVLDRLRDLPTAVVHHDLNTFNLLTRHDGVRRRVSGVIDFGDALPTARIADLAVLLSSALRDAARPLEAAARLAAAYHAACPLTEDELNVVFPLTGLRAAAVAATTARLNDEHRHGDPRHRSSATAELVLALAALPPGLGTAMIRNACGLPPHPASTAVTGWIADQTPTSAPVAGRLCPIDLSVTGDCFDGVDPGRPDLLRAAARAAVTTAATPADGDPARRVPVGRYGEPRFLGPVKRSTGSGPHASVHLGVDLFARVGDAVRAPLAGRVEATGTAGVDLVLLHEPADGPTFRLLYGGLRTALVPGEAVAAGQSLGTVAWHGTDDLSPHVRIQVSCVPVTGWAEIPADVPDAEFEAWRGLFPDPTPLLEVAGVAGRVAAWEPAVGRVLSGRNEHLPVSHPTYFRQPIAMVRARGCRFYDERGRSYLDALNNVTLVGHGHPRLVEAAARQLGRLNTNSRFVYDVLGEYAERLTATLPDGLDIVYFVNSGSEANDLALRMARYLTGRQDVVIIDDAYHGYTSAVADVSPSRYKHYGKPDTTHPTPVPDRYRGPYGYGDPGAGAAYADHVIETFDRITAGGRPPAAYLFEGLLAGGGQIVLPPGYLAPIFAAAAERGVLTIADEVQVGFGRLGEAFWGFQTQSVIPDFVTMGKAMGNGFPMAALVTTREISQAFDTAGRFFSTYGGNPVACAVGLELLDIVQDEALQHNALVVGEYLRDNLGALAGRHPLIGDVRGQGLYSGVEFVRDRDTKEPAADETLMICERLKDEGILVYPTGPHWNVLKLKPPLTFSVEDADELAQTLDEVLTRGW